MGSTVKADAGTDLSESEAGRFVKCALDSRPMTRTTRSRIARGRPRGVLDLVLRAVLVVLTMSMASSGMLPAWAALAGVEGTHVCHCSAEQ